MASAKQIMGVMIALTIGATLLNPLVGAVNDNVGEQSITNETVTTDASLGTTYELDGYRIVSGSETVYFENGTAGSFEVATGGGTDYTLHETNGSITLESGGEINSGDTVKISYNYSATTSTTTTVVELVPLFMGLLLLGVMGGKITKMMG